jgi:hypothetical protein
MTPTYYKLRIFEAALEEHERKYISTITIKIKKVLSLTNLTILDMVSP